MIRLSKMADHALVLCSALAARPGQTRSASEWAAESALSEATATKLLKKLCGAKICASARGKDGGYRLAQAASAVSFLAVVEAIDGPVIFSDCALGSRGCAKSSGCGAKSHVVKIGAAIRLTLSELTLGDLSPEGGPDGQ